MSLHLLIATAGLAGVLAAPVPEPTGAGRRLKWLYGIPSQAPNGGVIELTPCDKLRFLIPYYSGPDTAIAGWGANVTKSVVGDFVATVQVDESLPDYARALREGPVVSKLGFFLTPQSSVPFATEWSIDWKVETGVEQSSFVHVQCQTDSPAQPERPMFGLVGGASGQGITYFEGRFVVAV
ncbi:MAG: hypothetical protein U0871_23765 [Gemmataceae bacterium]